MNTKLLIITITLIILGGLFYWFQYRPSEIRKKCASVAQEESKPSGGFDIITNTRLEKANKAYSDCLAKEGLKPEILYGWESN